GKRVLSVSDNAFSFYQAKSFNDRQTNLTAVNDKVGIAMKTLASADKGTKGIKSELSKLEGMLKDLTTSAASNAFTFQATGTNSSNNVFNKAGSILAPVNTQSMLADGIDNFSTAASIFRKAGVTTATLLTEQVGAAPADTDLKDADILSFKIGGKELFLKVVNTTPVSQNQAGNTSATAIEVRTIGDIVNALNGKRSNGNDSLALTALFNSDDNVSAGWNATDGLTLSSSSTAARNVSLTRAAATAGMAAAIFGGTAGALVGTTSTTSIAVPAVANGTLRLGDIIQVKVGETTGGGTQQSLFLKVTKQFTGSAGAQKGDGLSAQPGGGSTGALEVRTIGDIVNALNGRNTTNGALTGFTWGAGNVVSASFDSAKATTSLAAGESRFSLNSATALQISLNRNTLGNSDGAAAANVFGGTAASIIAPGTPQATAVTNFTSQLTSAAQEKRTSVARVFQASLEQVDNLTNDATFGGNNLLNSAAGFNVDLTDASSASTLSKFQVKLSGATDAVSLGFAAKVGGVYQDGAQLNFNTNVLVNAALAKTQNALARLEGRQVEVDSLTDSLKTRSDFNNTVKASLGAASADLTALDQNEATAQAQAVNFANSVATKFLGTIGQRSQQLLQIF
ncbi:MAG: hypothetical protein ACKOC1_05830, partial [Hyphomicrobiales bacterium]